MFPLPALLCTHWFPPPLQQWLWTYCTIPESVGSTSFSPSPDSHWTSPGEGVKKRDLRASKHSSELQSPLSSGRNQTTLQLVSSTIKSPAPWTCTQPHTAKPTLTMDSSNTVMDCEQQTSKGPESQSPGSLSWQSTAPGAGAGCIPCTANMNPQPQLCPGTVSSVTRGSSLQGAQW